MKVKCIDNGFVSLTFGKEYDVTKVSTDGKQYHVVGDDNEDFGYPARSFRILPEINLPPMTGEYKEAVDKQLQQYTISPITYKDFLASMPKSASACVTMYGDGEVIANVYGFEFVCKSEERAEEVYAALTTLFKEN